jgi:Nucleotidyltransferase of unknown function (DUF6036)
MMNREKMTHILRAVATITNEKNFVLVGSASVLLTSRNIPLQMLNTNEIDVYSPDSANEDDFSFLVESIGKGSHFDKTFSYYADGVSSKTAKMPADWETRAKVVENLGIPEVTVLVPDINDIAIAKMFAWREKDREWLKAGVRSKILTPLLMQARLPLLAVHDVPMSELERRMQSVVAFGGPT